MVVLVFTKRTHKKERREYNWGNLGCRSMPGDFNTLNTCFFNLSLCLKHFLGPFFFFQSRTIALPAAFPVVRAYGSESNQRAVKVMQVHEIAPEAWEECVCKSISLQKIHTGRMWLFFPRIDYFMWSRLVQMGVDCIFTQRNEHWDYILEHLSNPLSNVDLFPFPTLWLLCAV